MTTNATLERNLDVMDAPGGMGWQAHCPNCWMAYPAWREAVDPNDPEKTTKVLDFDGVPRNCKRCGCPMDKAQQKAYADKQAQAALSGPPRTTQVGGPDQERKGPPPVTKKAKDMTVAELHARLGERKLSTEGSREELVARLDEHLAAEQAAQAAV